MKNIFAVVLTAIVLSLSAVAKTAPQQTALMPSEPLKAEGIWIDVRTPEEFSAGHLKEAVNIPLEQIADKIVEISPNKDEPINLYCRSGRRADVALQQLKALGYSRITNYGGYEELLGKGFR